MNLQVGSPDTDSSLDVLSPVPGTGFWDPDIALVSLHKGEEGLGFSILDFAVSLTTCSICGDRSKILAPQFNFPRTPTTRGSGSF